MKKRPTNALEHLHPFPDGAGVELLYKFTSLNPAHPEYLEQLLAGGLLYHSLPSELNDPWECAPRVRLDKPKRLRDHLYKTLRRKGATKKEAQRQAANSVASRRQLQKIAQDAVERTYRNVRVCSFATSKEHTLLWAHYANAHSGICLEFDASILPFSMAYRVQYQDQYPLLTYPNPQNARTLIPLLTKSSVWRYEGEFRSIYDPEFRTLHEFRGPSAVLSKAHLKSIYFGANLNAETVKKLLSWVDAGPFSPTLYRARPSMYEYGLEFKQMGG